MGDSSASPIYLFNHLFKKVRTHGYLFGTLVYNSIVYYSFFCCSNCFSFGHWKALQVGLHVCLMYPHHFVLPYSFKICVAVTHESPVLYCAIILEGLWV